MYLQLPQQTAFHKGVVDRYIEQRTGRIAVTRGNTMSPNSPALPLVAAHVAARHRQQTIRHEWIIRRGRAGPR